MKNTVLMALLLIGVGALLSRLGPRDSPPEAKPRVRLWENASFLSLLHASGKRGTAGIAIVAPASGLHSEESVQKAYDIADRLGVCFSREALKSDVVPYTANADDKRLDLLLEALRDPDIEVLWAFRGGYGSSRLLTALADVPAPANRKIFVGYSDMTFLHLFFDRWNWRTIHADMFWELPLAGESKDAENFRLLASLLAGREEPLRYEGLTPFNRAAKETSLPVQAAITGGNLTCLAAAVGTPYAPRTDERILFIEDVKERGYQIDRMLTQLRDAGAFIKVKAVILGSFSRGDEASEFALERFAADCDKPVFRTDLFGHGEKNYPLVFNSPAEIAKLPDGENFGLTIEANLLP